MSSAAGSTSTTRPVGARPRRWAAVLLLVGGLLAGVASFVPWVRISWQAIADEPASSITVIPGQDLALLLFHLIQTPLLTVSEFFLVVIPLMGEWGVPLLAIALGLVALVVPHPNRPGKKARISVGILIVLGVVWVGLFTLFAVSTQRFEIITTTNTLQVGPALALLGYLVALAGVIWLMPAHSRTGTDSDALTSRRLA